MFGSSRRNAIAMSIGWWYLRRLIRKRGAAAAAGLVAGHGLSFAARRPASGIRSAGSLVLSVIAGAGVVWWRRRRGGGDDWGDWQPAPPVSPEPEPTPMPEPEPVAT